MTTLHLKGTEDTPEILFDIENKQFVISGRSLPEDVTAFFESTLEWLKQLQDSNLTEFTLEFKLEYFNTASSKIILDILSLLEDVNNSGNIKIYIKWFSPEDDEDMIEAAEEYKELVELPFEIVTF